MTPQQAIDDAVTRSAGANPALISAMKAEVEAFVARTYPSSTGEVASTGFLNEIYVIKFGPFNLAWQLFPWPWNYCQFLGNYANGAVTFKRNFADWAQDSAFPGSVKLNETETFYATKPPTGTK